MLARDIAARPREWLAEGLLPRGRVTLITGSRGIGKGLVTCWLSAKVTNHERPVNVWINSLAEDDLAEDVRPRLEVAGADLDRVRLTDTEYSLPDDLGRLATDIQEFGADINFFDSLQTHLRTMSGDAENRTLSGLREMAKELGVAIVVLHHLLKSITTKTSVTQAISGSGAIQNRTKVIYVVGLQPGEDAGSIELRDLRAKLTGGDDEVDQREKLVLACERGWAGPIPSISFAKTTKLYAATGADEMYLESLGEVGCTAQQVLAATAENAKRGTGGDDSLVQSVARWILETLATQPTRMLPTNTLIDMAKKEDMYVRATFDRARSRAGVTAISPKALPLYLSDEDYAALSDEQRMGWWVAI